MDGATYVGGISLASLSFDYRFSSWLALRRHSPGHKNFALSINTIAPICFRRGTNREFLFFELFLHCNLTLLRFKFWIIEFYFSFNREKRTFNYMEKLL